ncbi:sulfopyruvate decarboxylase subunit beta [Methanococcoides methylutens]|uniref:sulfopyruvate decarboxylase n=1 Tax=Methanococcoides methylutens MM1 TaxID=1434104 RepID=A0A0E3SS87_METMT|nr:sulfopyruvate decarboxylase subunit beta [Methanococcoides methylutens]AKB86011.1 Sulfopyruvate decarboxylase - beta subunit [Methanococcoides methylutens MM1]
MKRIDAISMIARKAEEKNSLIVANIGYPSRELNDLKDRPGNFYMLGSMGLSSSIGLGLSLAVPERHVIAIDGDGSVLMNMGSLATIAHQNPENYLLVIIDNGTYGSTGDQPTATSLGTDLGAVAKGAGIDEVHTVDNEEDLEKMLKEVDRGVLVVRVDPGNASVPVICLSPEEIIERFMAESARPSE